MVYYIYIFKIVNVYNINLCMYIYIIKGVKFEFNKEIEVYNGLLYINT